MIPSDAAPTELHALHADSAPAGAAPVGPSPRDAGRPVYESRVLPWHSPARPEAEVSSAAPATRTSIRGALALLERPIVQLLAPPPHVAVRPGATANRILLALDDTVLARAVQCVLEAQTDAAWTVDVARSGIHALELAAVTPPCLVLLDVALAEMDGAAVYHQLRADPTTERTPVIFTTAATSLDLYERGIQEGLLLRKPFDLGDLVLLVRELLRQ